MKTKMKILVGFVFAILFSYSVKAAPTVNWATISTSSVMSAQTMDPDTSVSGGGINWLTSGDFNCDGYDDLVAVTGAGRYGKIFIHLGGASYSFPADVTNADYVITGSQTRQYLGVSPTKISDLDADGCPELVLNAAKTSSGTNYSALFLYYSSTITGWSTDAIANDSYTDAHADSELSMTASSTDNYSYIHNVGAINGSADGDYLAVCSNGTSLCYLMPTSALVAGSGTVESNSDYYIGSLGASTAITSGDFDGDGNADLLVGSPNNSGTDNVLIIYGPISDSTSTFNSAGYFETSGTPADDNLVIWNSAGTSGLGAYVDAIDADGDGKDEVVFSYNMDSTHYGYFYIVYGLDNLKGSVNEIDLDLSTGSFSSTSVTAAIYRGETGAYLGYSNNSAVGDFNGDGQQDVFFGGQNYKATTSKGRGYWLDGVDFSDDIGSTTVISATNRATAYIEGASNSDQLATKVITGDFDGDGDDAVVTYAYGANSSYGQLTVIEFPDDVDGDGIDAKAGDCNDADSSIGLGNTWYLDADGDGSGTLATSQVACVQPSGYVDNADDCNDLDSTSTIYNWWWDDDADGFGGSAHTESSCTTPTTSYSSTGAWVSNNDDCDDADASISPNTVWYADADGDTYGDAANLTTSCVAPSASYVTNSGDCDDTDASVMPDTVWYADADADGFGDAATTQLSCTQPTNYVEDNSDCDDSTSTLNPNTVWYADADGDGFGDASVNLQTCEQPRGYVLDATDTDDSEAAIYPGARENCTDGLDNDSNGAVDSADGACTTDDVDGDGVTALDGDCDDSDAGVYPSALELGDAIDNDCDGRTDENLASVTIASSLPTSVVGGDTFDLDVNVVNGTGLDNLEVQVWVPETAFTSSRSFLERVLNHTRFSDFGFSSLFCNSEASNCESLGTKSAEIDAGASGTVTVSVTVPELDAGSYVVRIRLVNKDTNEVVAYYKNPVFSSSRVALTVTE